MITLLDFKIERIKNEDKRYGCLLGDVENLLRSKGLWEEFTSFMKDRNVGVASNMVQLFVFVEDLHEFIKLINK